MDTHGHINFVDTLSSGLWSWLCLLDLASGFGGDPLSLMVLDVLAIRHKVPFSLSTVWEKLSNASEVARFIIACGRGGQKDTTEM
jgi:hypothetical protein